MKRVLVTGAKGMLGVDLCSIFAPHFDLLAVDVDELDVRRADSVGRQADALPVGIGASKPESRDPDAVPGRGE